MFGGCQYQGYLYKVFVLTARLIYRLIFMLLNVPQRIQILSFERNRRRVVFVNLSAEDKGTLSRCTEL